MAVTRPTGHATRHLSDALRVSRDPARVDRRILRQSMEDIAVSEHPATSPARALLEDAPGSFGKAVAAVAGAGIFLYLIGVAVLWLRLAAAGLQEQEVVAAIPRDQLAVLGAREALLSTISGILFALLLYAFFQLFRVSQQLLTTKGVRGVLARWMRERPALMLTVIIGGWCVLFVPLDTPGTLFLILFLANIYFGFRSAHRSLIGELPDFRTSVRPWPCRPRPRDSGLPPQHRPPKRVPGRILTSDDFSPGRRHYRGAVSRLDLRRSHHRAAAALTPRDLRRSATTSGRRGRDVHSVP
jgi:hypothetical protein